MRVHTIRARGLIPYPDEVLLDLDAIAGDLVAIVGEQGAGKSTLVECYPGAIHPDRRTPTRGILDSIATDDRDAFVDVTVSAAGHRYRVRQDIGRGEAHVYVDDVPLDLDKKVSRVGAWCAATLLPPDVVTSSLFLPQMSTGLVSADGTERRKTLLKAIGIAEIEALAKRARERRNGYAAQLDAVLAAIAKLRPVAETLPALTARAAELAAAVVAAETHHAALVDELATARATWDAYQDAVRARVAAAGRRVAAEGAVATARRDLAAYETRELSRAEDDKRKGHMLVALTAARVAWDAYQSRQRERVALFEKHAAARRTFDAADAAMVELARRHGEQVELGRRADTVRADAARARVIAATLVTATAERDRLAGEVRRLDAAAGADERLADAARGTWAAANGRVKAAGARAAYREAVDAAIAALPALRVAFSGAENREEAARDAVEAHRRAVAAGTEGRLEGLRDALGDVQGAETFQGARDFAESGLRRDDAAVTAAADPGELARLEGAARVARGELDAARAAVMTAERAAEGLAAVVAAEFELADATSEREAARADGVAAKGRAEETRARAAVAQNEADVVVALVAAYERELAPLAGAAAEELALAGVAALEAELAAQLAVATTTSHDAWQALAALPAVPDPLAAPSPSPVAIEDALAALPAPLPPLACPDVAGAEQALAALPAVADLPAGPARAPALLEVDLAASTRERGALDTARALLARDVAAAEQAARELDEQDVVRRVLDEQVADATLLADALGISGVQALEIDAAGPAITANWNLFLHEAYGARFTGEVSASRPVKDKKKAKAGAVIDEAQFLVHDALHGTCCDVSMKSGGEGAHLALGLFCAIALYNCRARGITEPTLFLDEPGSGLSEKTVDTWIDMARHAARLIGASKMVIVAHHPRVIEACDSVVRVIDGRLVQER